MPPLLLLRVVLQPPVHLHRVMHLVEALQVVFFKRWFWWSFYFLK
jgi:hypothetical protein